MADVDLRSLHFAAPAEGEDGVSAPFEVLRVGRTVHPAFGETNITEADLDNAVAVFEGMKAKGAELPVDWEHSFAEGGESRAAGWIADLFRKGKSLMARVKWNARARQDIESGEYRYISAEFNEDWADESGRKHGFTLLAAGLTNRPFLRGMGPVQLSERIPAGEVCFVFPAISSNSDERSETRREMADGTKTTPEKKDKTAADEPKTVTLSEKDHAELKAKADKADELQEAAEKASASEEKAKSFAEQNKALSDRIEKLEGTLLDEQRDRDLDKARREGRIDLSEETTQKWSERYSKLGRETAKELLFEMPADTVPVTERGIAGKRSEPEKAPEGVNPESHELDQRIRAYMEKNEGVSYTEAAVMIGAEG